MIKLTVACDVCVELKTVVKQRYLEYTIYCYYMFLMDLKPTLTYEIATRRSISSFLLYFCVILIPLISPSHLLL